jgi:hypothetical protein
MDERLRFVARLLEGEKMAPLCASSELEGAAAQRRNRNLTSDIARTSEPCLRR